MINRTATGLSKFSVILALAASLAAAPALAGKGGNGNGGGNSGDHGKSDGNGKSAGHGNKAGKTAAASAKPTTKKQKKLVPASALGNLNGFLHASPKALEKAAATSLIGKVVAEYGELLDAYLNPEEGEVPPTLEELATALDEIANKPLSPEVIGAINDKLAAYDQDMASAAGNAALAQEIFDSLAPGAADDAGKAETSDDESGNGEETGDAILIPPANGIGPS